MMYIRDSDVIPRTEKYVRAWINKADLPNPFTSADVAEYGWQEYVPEGPILVLTLESAKISARHRVNMWQANQKTAGFTALGHTWDSQPAARENLTNVALSGQNPLGFWTSADDVDVPVTVADLQTMYAAMLTKGAEIHARQREMKQAIEGMTLEQLSAFQPDWV